MEAGGTCGRPLSRSHEAHWCSPPPVQSGQSKALEVPSLMAGVASGPGFGSANRPGSSRRGLLGSKGLALLGAGLVSVKEAVSCQKYYKA